MRSVALSLNATWDGAPRRTSRLAGWPPSFWVGAGMLAVIVAWSFIGPVVLGLDPYRQDLQAYLSPPSWAHPFGTDGTGRDVFARVTAGGRPSLVIAAVGMAGSVILGVVVGMLAAFGGRFVARICEFAMDVQLALPYVLVAIVLVSVAGASVPLLIVMMVLGGWVQVGRVVRSIVISERSKDYVKAAAVIGASRTRIASRYVLPAVIPAVVALAPLQMAAMLVIEATLSFLGMGIRPPQASWGSVMLEGKDYVATAWWLTVCPGLAIFVSTLSLITLGDGIEKHLGRSIDDIEELNAGAFT